MKPQFELLQRKALYKYVLLLLYGIVYHVRTGVPFKTLNDAYSKDELTNTINSLIVTAIFVFLKMF